MSEHELHLGFREGGEKRRETVQLNDGTPDPWDLDTKLSVIGKDHPRLDGVDKVTGRAKYSYDRRFPGMIYAKMLRSPYAHARIKSVDVSKAKALKGVLYTETFQRPINYAGQEVAGVAAISEEILDDALQLIEVEYEVLPCSTTVEDAMKPDAAIVGRGNSNVRGRGGRRPGSLDRAHGEADIVIESEYRTQVQTHSCLETHGSVSVFDGDKLTVYASTQATFAFRATIARSLRPRPKEIEVITEHMGGGFGSKFGADAWDAFAARAARATGKPCRYLLDRREEHMIAGNRPDSIQKCKFSVKKDGTLMGAEVQAFGTSGVSGGGGGVMNPAVYRFRAAHSDQRTVMTHAGRGRAFRAPRFPQGFFALEGMIDELADAIGMDPLELRMRNDSHPVRAEQYKIGAKEIGWNRRKKAGSDKGPIKRGFGMSSAQWYHNSRPGRHGARVRIDDDGGVFVANGCQDIGTGTRTLLASITAEELGLKPSQIEVRMGHTRDPMGPPSGGSQTAPSIAPVMRRAAYRAKRELLESVAQRTGVDAAKLDLRDGKVVGGRPMTFAQACRTIDGGTLDVNLTADPSDYRLPQYAGVVAGVQFAEVEVDTETGLVKVIKVVAVQDCGVVVNPLLARSQINGAVIQGISYALFEDRVLDKKHGDMLNANFLDYKIAGAMDMPEIVSIAHTVFNGKTTTGVSSLGEPPAVATPGAIGNAVSNAIGARVRSMPITPDKILAALGSL